MTIDQVIERIQYLRDVASGYRVDSDYNEGVLNGYFEALEKIENFINDR